MSSTVRLATPADLPHILQLERATPEAPHWPEEDYAAALSAEPVPRCLFIAMVDHTLIGFAVARTVVPEAELETIAVALEHRQEGVGTALCQAVIEWCRAAGATVLQLEVRAASVGARRLYATLGFAVSGHRRNYYHHPNDDAILMRYHVNTAIKEHATKV